MSASRLPGIYFETVATPVPAVLPRMDIAAFVGFTPSGPLDVPVAVEAPARFEEIFGSDQALAWDPMQGETAYAQTPPAVRAFFRNGGKRCWVVRVADDSQAVSNGYLLPGMLQAVSGGPCSAGWLGARSEGSWSDDLMVNATLSFGPIEADPPQQMDGKISILLYPNSNTSVSAGDLLQISFGQPTASPAAASSPLLFLPAESVSYSTVAGVSGALQKVAVVSASAGYWFQEAAQGDFSAIESASPPAQPSDPVVQWLAAPIDVSWLAQPEPMSISILGWGIETGNDPVQFVLDAPRAQAETITAGTWLRVKLSPADLPGGAGELLLLVAGVRGSPARPVSGSPSPSGEDETLQILTAGAWWVLDSQTAWKANLSSPRVSVVTLELWVRDGTGQVTTLSDLGLTPIHPLYLGYLPTDAQLYSASSNPAPPPGIGLWDEVDHPRFALAAPGGITTSDPSTDPVYLPLGVLGILDSDFYQEALPQSGTPLERDGLALEGGQLTSAMFLDPDLAGANVDNLLTQAFHKLYQLQRGDGPVGEPLTKMHAVLPLTEVSLLALPDAIQPGWQQALQTQSSLLGPTLVQASPPDSSSQTTLSWTPVGGATSYTLEQSSDPLFSSATIAWQGVGQTDSTSPSLITSDPIPVPGGCPLQTCFRVAALQGLATGPWSNTLQLTWPAPVFQRCIPVSLNAPVIGEPTESRGRVAVAWSVPEPNVNSYQLQIAYEPAFALPEVLYEGPNTYFELWRDPSRTAYFRVSGSVGTASSPWSNTAVALSDQGYTRYVMNVPQPLSGVQSIAETELLAIHQAMFCLCAARADMFAFLSLPQAYDAATCVLYQQQLIQLLAAENGDTTLSFGAIFFPWLVIRDSADDQPGAIRTVTPEGCILGSTAVLTVSSGAWYSPANQQLVGVVDLFPGLDDQADLTFFNHQLNLVAQESRGFLAESSFTLSTNSQLAEMNVRRLLILLRRLALREGLNYVFQSNDTSLWRVVQRRFEEVLSSLFLQGAFSGSTPDQSFRVRTDSSINPPDSVADGRFIVEISVAPSLPLEFLTVQLVQTGGDLTFSEV